MEEAKQANLFLLLFDIWFCDVSSRVQFAKQKRSTNRITLDECELWCEKRACPLTATVTRLQMRERIDKWKQPSQTADSKRTTTAQNDKDNNNNNEILRVEHQQQWNIYISRYTRSVFFSFRRAFNAIQKANVHTTELKDTKQNWTKMCIAWPKCGSSISA